MGDVVVGVDGSELSVEALDRAADEAERRGARLRVVHAWQTPVWSVPPMSAAPPVVDPETCRAWAEQLVEKAIVQLTERRTVRCELISEVVHGAAVPELARAASGAELVVVGGRAHGLVARVLLGSVTDELLHVAPAPVMIVPTPTQHSGFRRVLVGTDGSQHAHAALRFAAAVAERDGVPLVVIRCWVFTTLPERPPSMYVPPVDELERQVEESVRREVDEHVPHQVQREIRVLHASASQALLAQVRDGDLLVLGARGMEGFDGLLLGSVADQCAKHARVPLVVVR